MFQRIVYDMEYEIVQGDRIIDKYISRRILIFGISIVSRADSHFEFSLTTDLVQSGLSRKRSELALRDNKGAEGKTIKCKVDKQWKIESIDDSDGLAKAFPTIDLTELVQTTVCTAVVALPAKKVRRTDRWEVETSNSLNNGTLSMKGKVKSVSLAETFCRIQFDAEWRWKKSGNVTASGFDEIKGDDGLRTVWYDSKRGRVSKIEDEYTQRGDYSSDDQRGGEKRTAVIKTVIVSEFSDQSPIEKARK